MNVPRRKKRVPCIRVLRRETSVTTATLPSASPGTGTGAEEAAKPEMQSVPHCARRLGSSIPDSAKAFQTYSPSESVCCCWSCCSCPGGGCSWSATRRWRSVGMLPAPAAVAVAK